MKKLLFIWTIVLCSIIGANAQTPLLSEGFENGIPSTWFTYDADGDYYGWTTAINGEINSANAHTGTGYAYSRSWISVGNGRALTPDNWLITPRLTLPSTSNFDLTFWVSAMQDNYPYEHYGIYISTSNNPVDLSSYELLYENTLSPTHGGNTQSYWQEVVVSLADYSGNVYIAFRHFNCTDWVALCIDDVKVDVASPSLTVNNSEIQFGNGLVGNTFPIKQFNVAGANLTSNVTLTLPTGTPFSLSTDMENYSNAITLTPNATGRVNSDVYVSFNPTTAGYYESVISISSQAGTRSISLMGLAIDCSQNQSIPWFETFVTAEFPSNCWTMISTDTADYVNEGQLYPGTKRYTWYNSITNQYVSVLGDMNGIQDEHLYTPTFDLSNATGAADFQFELRTNPTNNAMINGQVRFYVEMSIDNGNHWITVFDVADIRADFSAYWTNWSDVWPVSINMDQYLGSNAQIKFDFHYEADSGAADQVIIQAVKFTNYDNPIFNVNAPDMMDFFTYVGHPETFAIPFNARNMSEAISVSTSAPFEVSTDGDNFATTAVITTSNSPLYIRYNPLTAGNHNAVVTLSCNYTDPSNVYPSTVYGFSIVVTGNSYNCSVIDLPIAESFESAEGTVLAPNTTEYCWRYIKSNTADPQNDMINSTDYAYVGSQSFRFSSNSYNSQHVYDQYLISPELTANNPMLVMFNYVNATALKDETFCVGYSTTGSNIEDFTWEEDIVNVANTDWQLYHNGNVPANVKYIAIHYKSQHQAYLYIDNFQIMEAPSCIFPVELRAENTAADHADLVWTAVTDETSWELVYGVAPLTVTTATPILVNTLGTTINGLTANTHYQFALRSICGTSHSDWSEVADFWTTTIPATVPYVQTFEDYDADRANWVLVNGNQANYFTYGNITYSVTGKALMITKDDSTNTYLTPGDYDYERVSHYSTVWAYRDIQFPETQAPGFLLSLRWRCQGEVNYDFGEMFLGNATEVTNFERNENKPGFVDVNASHYIPEGLTKLDRFVNSSSIQTGSYFIPAEEVAGQVKRLYFLWTNDSLTGAEPPLAVDNIQITIPQFSNMNGLITDAESGAPIVGARVSVVSNQGLTATATTDNTGNYLIENLVTGFYTITISANGYQNYHMDWLLSEGDNNISVELSPEDCTIIPTGLISVIEDDNMTLSWNAIESGVISQATSSINQSYIGAGSSYSFGCYHLFEPAQLTSYNGGNITSIGIYVGGDLNYCTYTLQIYTGGSVTSGPASDIPIYEQVISPDDITLEDWNDITLTNPFAIDASQCIWVGYLVNCNNAPQSIYSAGVTDQYNANEGYGNVMYNQGSWTTLATVASSLAYNWMIRANVVAPELTYNVMEDQIIIATGLENTEYEVSPFDPNACYQVAAVCENGKASDPSFCATPLESYLVVQTNGYVVVSSVTANVGFRLSSDELHLATMLGICWDTIPNPTFNGNNYMFLNEVPVVGHDYVLTIDGLQAETGYYVRAFAMTQLGTVYGNEETFMTQSSLAPAMGQPCSGTPTVTDHQGNVYNTVQIGSQCWTRENMRCTTSPNGYLTAGGDDYDVNTPCYYYGSSAIPLEKSGLYYNWAGAMDTTTNDIENTFVNRRGICPEGWHVPTIGEWETMELYVYKHCEYRCNTGDSYNNSGIGKALASTEYWLSGDWGVDESCNLSVNPSLNNVTGFSAIPASDYTPEGPWLAGLEASWWSSTSPVWHDEALYFTLWVDGKVDASTYYDFHGSEKNNPLSVRCVRDEPIYSTGCSGVAFVNNNETYNGTESNYTITSVTDGQGNSYSVMSVGSQCWMAENMRATAYSKVYSNSPLSKAENQYGTEPLENPNEYAFYSYPPYSYVNGLLYSWYAATDNEGYSCANVQGICPNGWHVPNYFENEALACETVSIDSIAYAFNWMQWSSKELGGDYYNYASIYWQEGDDYTFGGYGHKQDHNPVRCVRDDTPAAATPNLTVITSAATGIEQTSATLNGSVSNPDNLNILARGFVWRAANDSVYNQVIVSGTANSFTANLTGALTANTQYTYNTFVTTADGTAYGSEQTFITSLEGIYIMPVSGNETVTTCNLLIYDDGGPDSNRSQLCWSTLTINPSGDGSVVMLTGTIDIDEGWDYLNVYDGVGTSGALLFSGTGQQAVSVISTTGPLTIRFSSYYAPSYAGFELMASCVSITCPTPTNLTVANVGVDTADLSWTVVGQESNWEVEYGVAGFNHGEGTVASVSGNPSLTLTGLAMITPYDVYVRAVCGANDTSLWWCGPVRFTTEGDGTTCSLSIRMYDSYGDGWTGNKILVHNHGITQEVTLSDGYYEAVTVPVASGTLELEWVDGMYKDECSVTILGPCIRYSDSIAPSGYFLSGNIDCESGGTPAVSSFTYWLENTCNSVIVHFVNTSTDANTASWNIAGYTTNEWNPTYEFTASGTYTVKLQAGNSSCESGLGLTQEITVTMPVAPTTSLDTVICDNYLPFTWYGHTFTDSGTYTMSLSTASGCDSLVTLTLMVNPSNHVNVTQAICPSELPYTWNGVQFIEAGTQVITLQSINGCDSVVTMTLTVNPTYEVADVRTICESQLPYTWNGVLFTEVGTQTTTLQSSNGCDSVVTMTLTVTSIYSVNDAIAICVDELPYIWNGVEFTAAGTQTVRLQAMGGCDSVVTMTLTVNQPTTGVDVQEACDSFEWINGETYTESTNAPTFVLPNAAGCDSVVTLNLTINHSVIVEIPMIIAESDLPYTIGDTTFEPGSVQSGDYTFYLATADGCDSIIILHLTVTGVEDYLMSVNMNVYPNPTTDKVKVQLTTMNNEQLHGAEIQLYDMYGKWLHTWKVEGETTEIDLSSFAASVYFIKAVDGQRVVGVRKIVKQ